MPEPHDDEGGAPPPAPTPAPPAMDSLASLFENEDMGPTIKTVFEGGREDAFVASLDELIAQKDHEVEELCKKHYQEFIDSVDHLLTLRADTAQLQDAVVDQNHDLQETGETLVEQSEELLRFRRIRQNLDVVLEGTRNCARVMDMYGNVVDLVQQKKYHKGIKVLDQLEEFYLPRVQELAFAQRLRAHVPVLRDHVKSSVTIDFNGWLENVRSASATIGRIAMATLSDQTSNPPSSPTGRTDRRALVSKRRSVNVASTEFAGQSYHIDNVFEQAGLDFTPVYRCLYIHQSLGCLDEFRAYFTHNRRLQANLSLQPKGDFTTSYTVFFQQLVGFFLIEDHVLKTTDGLITQSGLEALWELVVARIRTVLKECFETVRARRLLEIKDYAENFCRALYPHGFEVEPLVNFLDGTRVTYGRLLLNQFVDGRLDKAFLEEKYESLTVTSPGEYHKLILQYSLVPDASAKPKLPVTFPFSATVPRLCEIATAFVNDLAAFPCDESDVDDYIKKLVEELLHDHVSVRMAGLIASANQILQAVQWLRNAEAMVSACTYLERSFFTDPITKIAFRLDARAHFHETRARGEDRLSEIMVSKVDEFFGLGENTVWVPTTPNQGPRDFVQDLSVFLATTMVYMDGVSQSIREAVFFNACKQIATLLLHPLTSGEVKRFNSAAVANLGKDLVCMEQFASNAEIPFLIDCFSEVRQLVDLLQAERLDEFLDPAVRSQKYARLDVPVLVGILDKYRDDATSRFGFGKSTTTSKRRQEVEALIKQLGK